MNTRTWWPVAIAAVVASAAGFWLGRQSQEDSATAVETVEGERTIKFYQSPMHPWIVSETPGRCTICGMELVPVYEGESGADMGEAVQLNDRTAGVIGVRTATTEVRALQRTLRVNGVFEVDHTRHRVLSARVPGRIEELHIDQVGIHVEAGEPLATLYSPEMLSAQRIYLERLISGPDAISSSQLAEARERLWDLGATEADIARLETTQKPEATVTVRAPFAGTVISRGERAFAGTYVEESDTLFELGELDHMWFLFDAYEADLDLLETGQSVGIYPASKGSEAIFAPISFINPNLHPQKRTASIRVAVPNSNRRWHHLQTARAEVVIELGEHLSVPRSAVLFTRQNPVAFERVNDQTYLPRELKLGPVGQNNYAVLEGLTEGSQVVTEAALLLEGQAQLNVPVSTSERPPSDGHGMATDTHTDIAALQPLILATADATAALAADDLNGFIEALPELHTRWQDYVAQTPDASGGPLDKMVLALADGPTLKDAREPFESFSTAIADLARQAGLHTKGEINIFQCPMTPVLGTGRWVQRDNELRNPFFGSAMLNCGTRIN